MFKDIFMNVVIRCYNMIIIFKTVRWNLKKKYL